MMRMYAYLARTLHTSPSGGELEFQPVVIPKMYTRTGNTHELQVYSQIHKNT